LPEKPGNTDSKKLYHNAIGRVNLKGAAQPLPAAFLPSRSKRMQRAKQETPAPQAYWLYVEDAGASQQCAFFNGLKGAVQPFSVIPVPP
jgi:hypothetical protein